MKKNLLKLLALSAMVGSSLIACGGAGGGDKPGPDPEPEYAEKSIASIVELDDETFEPVLKGSKVQVTKGYHYESFGGNKFILADTTWADFVGGEPTTYDEEYSIEVVLADGESDIVCSDGSSAFGHYCNVQGVVGVTDDGRPQIVDASVSFWNDSEEESEIGYFLAGTITSSTQIDDYITRQNVGYHVQAQITIQSDIAITQAEGGSFTYSVYGEKVDEYNVYTCYIPGSLTDAEYANYGKYVDFKKGDVYTLYMSAYWADGACTMLMPMFAIAKRITKADIIGNWGDAWAKASEDLTTYANNSKVSAGHLEELPDLSGLTVEGATEFAPGRVGVYYGNSAKTVLVDIYNVKCMGECTEETVTDLVAQLAELGYEAEEDVSSYDGETDVMAVDFGASEDGNAQLTADIYLDDSTLVVQFFYWFMAA